MAKPSSISTRDEAEPTTPPDGWIRVPSSRSRNGEDNCAFIWAAAIVMVQPQHYGSRVFLEQGAFWDTSLSAGAVLDLIRQDLESA